MKHLIIGFCAAGANAADAIRRADETAEITVLNGEGRPFYLRLDLEGIFLGKSAGDLQPRPETYWAEKHINVVNERAVKIDPGHREVTTASGRVLRYDKLLIATGSRPRKLQCPGTDLEGVHIYHGLEDAERILDARTGKKHAVMIGGGILGLEMARVAVDWEWETTVIVRGSYVGSPIVDPDGGEYLLEKLHEKDVHVFFHDEVSEFVGENGRLTEVRTIQGRTIPTGFACVCIGVQPDVTILDGTGVLTDGQLLVNDRLETPVPHIYAAGDVALVRTGGNLVPCNTWHVAVAQSRTAAANMLGQSQIWEEGVQYNLDMLFEEEIAIIGPWERRHEPDHMVHVLRDEHTYRALVTRDGILIAALLVGSRFGDRRVRKLIATGAHVEGKLDRVFHPDSKPEEFATQ